MNSILTTIKSMLAIPEDQDCFDAQLIVHINTAFMKLWQEGIGTKEPFMISDSSTTWDEFYEGKTYLEPVKMIIYLETKLIFDPSSPGANDACQRTIDELAYRLYIECQNRENEEGRQNGV